MSLIYFLHRVNCHIKYESGLKKFGAHSCRAPNVHQTLIEGAQNIVHQHYFHGNQYIQLLHHIFLAINKIKITCFYLQAITASQSVQVPHCSLHT